MNTHINKLLASDLFQAAITFGTFALTAYVKVKYGSGSTLSSNIESNSGSYILYPSHSPGVGWAYYHCSNPFCPNKFDMYDAKGLLIDSRTIKPWQSLNISFVTQLNRRPWINSVLIENGIVHTFDPAPLISPNQYNKLEDIYYNLINHENLGAVISNLRDAL